MKIKLTPAQADALRHRLDVADGICEVLDEYAPEDVDAVCGALLSGLDDDVLITWEAELINEGLAQAVLAECVEGSTIVGCMKSAGRLAECGAIRALENLADKLRPYVGRNLKVPTY